MGKGHQKGRGKGGWKDREDDRERLRRDDDIEARYRAPASATMVNSTAFIFCLSLYLRKIIEPVKETLQTLDCFIKISKRLSWLFCHGKSLLHHSLSLTLNELFHFREFMKHTNTCLTFITDFDRRRNIFGKFDTPEIREHCKNERVNFDSMRFFIIFVTVTWFNDKGRIHLAVINESPVREPRRNEWISTTVSEHDVNEFIRHNGFYKTTHVFFRAHEDTLL